jgi:hypothetical protein
MRPTRSAAPTAPRLRLRAALVGGALALAAAAAAAQGDAADADAQDARAAADALSAPQDIEPELLPTAELDHDVFTAMPPGPPVLSRALLASAVQAVVRRPVDPRSRPIVPATAPATVALDGGPKPLGPVDPSAIAASQATLRLIPGQFVQLHADGLPGPAAPSADPFVRVLPLQVDPNNVKVGARWGSEDRIAAPLLSEIALSTQADLFAGPAPRTGPVRRSLRITAQWDTLSDLTFGLTPGVQRIGGGTLEHYVAGLQASTLDPHAPPARWRSFIEVSGEKISPNNLIENSTAQVHAGATYASSNSTQLDFSVTRGTMYQSDLTSSVGLQVKF